MSRAIGLEPGSVYERKGRLFLEGAVIRAGHRSAYFIVVGDDYATLDTDASGEGLRFLVDTISEAAVNPPTGPPQPVAVSHISDMPGEGPVQVHWSFDAARRARLGNTLKERLPAGA